MATTQASSNRRIAKNTVALYLRMFLTMIVGFYTSRVVLNTLGVQDYGIYGVVGGVIAMMGFLNAAMAGATSRFLTFELGRGDSERLAKTFSSALIIHMGIALVVMVLGETVGLWFLCNKLVIPPSRMEAAHWVYQLSIMSSMIGITQAPYDASIISHEKMNVYAYVEILNSLLKLAIVYLLVLGHFDKLKLYAVLTLAVSVTIMLIYRVYCLRHFKETHFHWVWDKAILKPLLSFSGWNIYGNFGSIVYQQGTNFVINFFFGVIMNAAVNVGLTIANVVNSFASNVMIAFRPQIIKHYAQGDVKAMQDLTIIALKVILIIYALVAIPTFIESDDLLAIWLVKVPKYSNIFCRLLLISIFFEVMRYILIIDIHSSGNVKLVSAFSGTIMSLVPVITFFLFKLGLPVEYAFITSIVSNLVLSLLNVYLIKHYIPSVEIQQYFIAIIQVTALCAFVLYLCYITMSLLDMHYIRIVFTAMLSTSLLLTMAYFLCFDKWQRRSIIDFINKKIHLS